MQSKQNKAYVPIILSTIVGLVVFGFAVFTILNNKDDAKRANEQIPTQGPGAPIDKKDEDDNIPIISIQKIERTFTDDISISLIQSKETYDYLGKLLQADLNEVDFSKHDVLLAHFYSNGCGLVIEQIKLKESELQVELMLPEELRKNKDLVCTEIALSNTVFVVIPKTTFKTAYFIRNNEPSETKFNILTMPLPNDLSQMKEVKSIFVHDPTNKTTTTMTDEKQITAVQTILNHATKQEFEDAPKGAGATFRLTIKYADETENNMDLFLNDNMLDGKLLTNPVYTLDSIQTHLLMFIVMNVL